MTRTASPNGEIIELPALAFRYSAAWAERDLDAILSLHTEDTVFHLHGQGNEPVRSAESVREAFARILATSADFRCETSRVRFGGDHFVSEYVLSGTVGDRRVACDGVDVISVREGRVARRDTYIDRGFAR